jgi:hypothetical protein
VEFYHGCLLDSTEGLALLSQNGLWDPGLIERFQLGYCDGSLTDILSPQDPAREPLLKEGLLIPNGRTVREALLGMITAPLCDPDGGVSGLAGWNPSHTAMIVTKGHPIWNLPVCYRVAHILITQTLLDGLCLVRSGLDNVIAILSTPDTNMNMNRALLQAGAHSIHIIGTKPPSRKWLEALALPEMLFLSLPQSPHEILRQTNPLTLLEQVSQARRVPLDSDSGLSGIDLLDGVFAATFGSRRYEIRGLFKRDHQLKATLRTEHNGHLHIDTVDLYSARSRKALARDLRRLFVQEAQLIDADIDRLVRLCEEVHPSQLSLTSPGSLPASPILTLKEREEAERFGTDPDLINRILANFDACGLIGESANKLLGYLAMTSRKLPHPLSMLTLSSSGAGKSTLQDSILAFCPPEDIVRLTSLSSRALFYKAPFNPNTPPLPATTPSPPRPDPPGHRHRLPG